VPFCHSSCSLSFSSLPSSLTFALRCFFFSASLRWMATPPPHCHVLQVHTVGLVPQVMYYGPSRLLFFLFKFPIFSSSRY
jgi:hypothetical protein